MQQEVLAYALAAVLVRPFGRNLSTLAQSAAEAATAENGGSRRFGVLWRELEEQVLLMEREPFRDLNFLVEQCGYEESRAHLEKGLRAARQIVQGFLLR